MLVHALDRRDGLAQVFESARLATRAATFRRKSAASPTANCNPPRPSGTNSAMPPMFEVSTGTPAKKASWITSGEFS